MTTSTNLTPKYLNHAGDVLLSLMEEDVAFQNAYDRMLNATDEKARADAETVVRARLEAEVARLVASVPAVLATTSAFAASRRRVRPITSLLVLVAGGALAAGVALVDTFLYALTQEAFWVAMGGGVLLVALALATFVTNDRLWRDLAAERLAAERDAASPA